MNRRAVWMLGLLHGAILLAGFFAPYVYDEQHRDFPYVPPRRLHWFDSAGRFHLRPFVFGLEFDRGTWRDDVSRTYPLRFFVAPGGGNNAGILPLPVRFAGVDRPGTLFLLGTDGVGRDVLSRLLYGAQVSVFTGFLAAAVSLVLGLTVGAISGFFAGWIDHVLMRFSELFMALPWVYMLLGVRAVLPLRMPPFASALLLIALIGGLGWVRPARLVRGVVLEAREKPFVIAARHFGASAPYLLRRHILPLTAGVLLTQATVLIPRYILAEIGLSFLGLGVGEPVPSWGNMLSEARQYHAVVSHPWMLAPGFVAALVVLVFLLAGDSLMLRHRISTPS
jgi:peptide/nickel transport system permease protein